MKIKRNLKESAFTLSKLEDYMYANEKEIRNNMRIYGFKTPKDVADIGNYIDFASVLGIDSRLVKDVDLDEYTSYLAGFLNADSEDDDLDEMRESKQFKTRNKMKLTLKERQLIKEYAKSILREEFKSDLMRKLNQYNIPRLYGRGDRQRLTDGMKITDVLKSLNIRANTITDNDIKFFTAGSGNPRVAMSANPNNVVIFVDNKKWIAGIMQNNKHVYIRGQEGRHVNYKDNRIDPKSISVSDKSRYAKSSASDGSTMQDKTGLSSEYRITNADLFAMAHFVITPNDSEVNKPRPNNQGYSPKTMSSILQEKRYEYEKKIKEMRAAKRAGSFPDDILQAAERILTLNSGILEWTKKVLNNPDDFKYKTVDSETHYGSGRDRRTYTSSVLKKYLNACKEVTNAEQQFSSGESYSLNSFKSYCKDIDYIINKN